jgi:hypothetical protein
MRTYLWALLAVLLSLANTGCDSYDETFTNASANLPPAAASPRNQGAEVRLDFNIPRSGGSVLGPEIDTLEVTGYDGDGNEIFEPLPLDRPYNDILVLNLHASTTAIEVVPLESPIAAQATTARTVIKVPVKIKQGTSLPVVVHTVVENPPLEPLTPPLIPTTPTLPAWFMAGGSGITVDQLLVIGLDGNVAGIAPKGGFSAAEINPAFGTLISKAATLTSVTVSYTGDNQNSLSPPLRVTVGLYASTNGDQYAPYGFPIDLSPELGEGTTTATASLTPNFPLLGNTRYVWVAELSPTNSTMKPLLGKLSVAARIE